MIFRTNISLKSLADALHRLRFLLHLGIKPLLQNDGLIFRPLLKAFTLMELLVGMVLMSIISVIAFFSYMLIQNQFFQLQQTQGIAHEYQEIRKVLTEDFQRATWIKKSQNQLILNRDDGYLFYDIKEPGLIRYHSKVLAIQDTFNIRPQDLTCLNNGEKVQEGIIDHLIINLMVFEEAQRLSIKKEYSAAALINYSDSEY